MAGTNICAMLWSVAPPPPPMVSRRALQFQTSVLASMLSISRSSTEHEHCRPSSADTSSVPPCSHIGGAQSEPSGLELVAFGFEEQRRPCGCEVGQW
jgi:hypothetical protein